MSELGNDAACYDLKTSGFDAQKAGEQIWEALLSAGAFFEANDNDPYIFASGLSSTIKVNAEVLDKKPRQREIVLGHVASFPCIREADALLYVPEGMRNFTNVLGHEMGILVVQARRVEGSSSRYDFEFIDDSDKDLALSAKNPRILEDIVTTLGSVAGIVRLLDPERQNIHSLAFLLRGEVNPNYQAGLTDHYLLKRKIPTNKEAFKEELTEKELLLYRPSHKTRREV